MDNTSSKKQISVAVGASLLIILGSIYISYQLKLKPKLETVVVKKTTVTQGVNVDGTVKPAQDLGLAFEQGGTISKINVKVGDRVKAGQVLAELNNNGLSASVNQASAAVQGSQATYEKLVNGATAQDIAVAQVTLDSAKTTLKNVTAQQQVLVDNAYSALLNSNLSAIPSLGNTSGITATITGTYTGKDTGAYKVTVYATGNGTRFAVTGLETADGQVDTTPQALGTKGLFIQFSTISVPGNNTWTVNLPNTQAASYVANNNAYQSALQTQSSAVSAAQNAVTAAQAALDLKKSNARPEDIAAANAQLNATRAQYQQAQNSYAHSQLVAPIDGVITSVDAKIGQTVAGSTIAPGIPAIKMISDQKFQVEGYVAENEIGKIKNNDTAQVTLDAYGNSTVFPCGVTAIDPAATIVKGISTYKVTLQFNSQDDRIRSGMGASATINDDKHENAMAVPKTALLQINSKTYVLVDAGQGNFNKVEVTTGFTGVDGNIEILSGLSEGQTVAGFGN